MKIRKLFRYEQAHIVRKAYSTRCANNIHGHSYVLEVILKGDELDESGMVIDFSKVKVLIWDFIDSFDHSLVLRNLPEEKELIDFAVKHFDRVVVLPFNSTAELQAKLFFDIISRLLPKGVIVDKCKVHETTTGYGEYYNDIIEDYEIKWFTKDADLEVDKAIHFSQWIIDERKDKERTKRYANTFIM